MGNTSYAGTGATVGPAHQGDLSRSAAGNTAGTTTGGSSRTGYSEKTWSHEHNAHGHEYAGDPCADEPPAPGAPHFAPGPHSLDTANRLDPHVSGGGFSGAPLSTAGIFASSTGHDQLRRDAPLGSGATGTQSYEPSHDIPSSTTDGSMSLTGNHHPGRVAESGAGIGGPGARAGVTSRDVPSSSTTEHERTTAGPHSSDMMNQLDPRVDSDLSKQQGYSGATGTTGLGSRSTTDPSTSREHHPGRDAAATGAGGAAFYEGAKHRDRDLLEGTTDSGYANPYPPSSIGAGLAKESSTTGASAHTDPGSTDYSTGLGSGPGSSATRNTTSTDPNTTEKDHHYGRDAGILGAGAGAGAAYEADKHLRGSHGDTTGTRSTDPVSSRQPLSGASGTDYGRDTSMSSPSTAGLHESRYHPSATSGVAGQPSAYDDRNRVKESHIGRDAALGAGAGAGAAAAAGEAEFSKKEAEREQKTAYKEELKEQKAAHKEEEKAAKHHQHEVEKAEKKHQHDVEKAQKAHDKKLEKEEAKHHKEEPKEGEKKHHGLLGLFHREKPDKDLKEDEAARKERVEQEAHPGADTTAASAGGAIAGTEGLTEKEKHGRAKEHDRNRLHKDPPPGYADVPTKGYAIVIQKCGCAKADLISVTERGDTIDSDRRRDGEGRLTEPHTGLPINTQKGDGAGGTDSTPIAGYHPEQSGTHGTDTITTSGEGGGFGHFQDHAR